MTASLVPLFRLSGHGDHFYTTSATERDAAIANYGYVSEGIAGYVFDGPLPIPAPPPDVLPILLTTLELVAEWRRLAADQGVPTDQRSNYTTCANQLARTLGIS